MSNQKGDGNIITVTILASVVLGLIVIYNGVSSVRDYNLKIGTSKEVVHESK